MVAEGSNYRYGECCLTCGHCTGKLCGEGDGYNVWTHCQEHGYINVHIDGKCDLYISNRWELDEDSLDNIQDE